MARGSVTRRNFRAFSLVAFVALWFGAPLPARSLEMFDGRIQAHGFLETQVRGISDGYGLDGEEMDLAMWYNILNVEFEFDILPDGYGPIDLLEAYVRVEARYDCIYSYGCGLFPSVDTYGNNHNRLPNRSASRTRRPRRSAVSRSRNPSVKCAASGGSSRRTSTEPVGPTRPERTHSVARTAIQRSAARESPVNSSGSKPTPSSSKPW
jgi:hypothetical protein